VQEDQQVRYAAFHLTGAAHLWSIRPTKDVPIAWVLFNRCILCDFGPPIWQDTLGNLAPPRHTGTVNDYISNFAVYGITSELH
jgi:hypothetical protein